MKNFRNLFIIMIATAGLIASGCQNKEAMKALQELTGQLAEQAKTNGEILKGLEGDLNQCKASVAKVKGMMAPAAESRVPQIPTMDEKVTVATLEAYKTALNDTLEKQKSMLSELRANATACAQELAAARKQTGHKTAAKSGAKPTAVKNAEAKGVPTTGVRNRYKPKN